MELPNYFYFGRVIGNDLYRKNRYDRVLIHIREIVNDKVTLGKIMKQLKFRFKATNDK